MDGFLLSPEKKLTAGGWVTSAPRKITGSLKTFGRMLGTKILKRKDLQLVIITSFIGQCLCGTRVTSDI
jgi:hypothetical protein